MSVTVPRQLSTQLSPSGRPPLAAPVEPRRPATVRMARWSATHPWRAIAMWMVFVATCIGAGNILGLRSMSDLDAGVGQSGRAAQIVHDAGLDSPDTENVLITARSGSLSLPSARQAAAQVRSRMASAAGVADVGAAQVGKADAAVMVPITLRHGTDSAANLVAITAQVQKSFPGLRVEEVGTLSMNDAVNDQVGSDLGAAAKYSLPVTLVILLLAFGAILAAGVPVLLALSAVAAATGLSAIASQLIPDSGSTSSMILLMGMAVGVDYSLFYVKRAREERGRGRSHLDAIELAAETSGHSVLVSGAAVITAMVGLFLAQYAVFSSLAIGSIIVVAVAVLGSLTVLPAVLVKLGRAIDRPRVPLVWRLSAGQREPRVWSAILRPALHRPVVTLLVTVVAMLALAAPALGLKLQSGTADTLPDSIAEVGTLHRLTDAFPSQNTSHQIVVQAPAAQAGVVTARLTALGDRLSTDPFFAVDRSAVKVIASKDGRVHTLEADAPYDSESAMARKNVTDLRESFVPQAISGVPGAHAWVGGDTASNIDTDRLLSDRLPWVVGFVVGLTMLIMGWVFRSVVIAVTTALVNLLSAAASFGVLALVFQHTWAEGLLDFHSTGKVINWVPLFTFAVLFGLSMDYHVFVISRIREAAASGLSTREAVRRGITGSAGTVTSAAIVMVSVFSIFAMLHMVEMKELGVSLAAAVLIDALVVRVVLLPSLMTLLGRANWWPGKLPAAPATADAASPVRV